MTQTTYYSDWKERITFTPEGPSYQELIVTDSFRAVLVGLEAGQKIAPHTTSAGAYHFLDGSGWMVVNGERYAIKPGATIAVGGGASRGVEAETRLAFLGTQASMGKPETNR